MLGHFLPICGFRSFTTASSSASRAHCVCSASSAASSTMEVDSVRRLWKLAPVAVLAELEDFAVKDLVKHVVLPW